MSMAYLNSDSVMPQSLDPNLQETLDETLKRDCPEVIPEARAISMIMLEDGETLDRLGVYYNLNHASEGYEKMGRSERELGPTRLVEVIKKRNPAGYDKLNFQICTAMYLLSSDFWYQKKYPKSCQGEKWRAVGKPLAERGWYWDHTIEDEKEAISIYKQMVKEAGLKPEDGRLQSFLYPDENAGGNATG